MMSKPAAIALIVISAAAAVFLVPLSRRSPSPPTEISSAKSVKTTVSSTIPVRPPPPHSESGFEDLVHNFGEVYEGEIILHDFKFTNHGRTPIEVVSVDSTCGCTVAGKYSEVIDPGSQGVFPVKLETKGLMGPVDKFLKVRTRAPAEVKLSLRGTVRQSWSIYPSQASMGIIKDKDAIPSVELKIVNKTEKDLKILEVTSELKNFETVLETIKEDAEYKLIVRAIPPFAPGANKSAIRVRTNSVRKPEAFVEAFFYMESPVESSPNKLKLPPAPLPKEITKQVFVSCNDGNAIEVKEVTVSADGVTWKMVEMLKGKQFRITLTFPEGTEIEHEELRIRLSHPEIKELVLPITHFR